MEQNEKQIPVGKAAPPDWPVSIPEVKEKAKGIGKAKEKNPFQIYMKKNYAEHFRRIKAWRRAARLVLFFYPLLTGLALSVPFFILRLVAEELYRIQPSWFVEFINPETQAFVLPFLMALTFVAFFLGIMTGFGLGLSRSRVLNFEAERTELLVQQNYYLRRMVSGRKGNRRGMKAF